MLCLKSKTYICLSQSLVRVTVSSLIGLLKFSLIASALFLSVWVLAIASSTLLKNSFKFILQSVLRECLRQLALSSLLLLPVRILFLSSIVHLSKPSGNVFVSKRLTCETDTFSYPWSKKIRTKTRLPIRSELLGRPTSLKVFCHDLSHLLSWFCERFFGEWP